MNEMLAAEKKVAAAAAKMKASERRQYRIDHGMCPECGKEAAPYYLCHEHRRIGAMRRMLNKMAEREIITKVRSGRGNMWWADKDGKQVADFTWGTNLFEMDPDDKRLRPRLGRRPVDLDETLFAIFRTAGKPLTMDEVYAAWGRLRTKRKTESLAGDMAAIIAAERRREARARKLAARFEACPA